MQDIGIERSQIIPSLSSYGPSQITNFTGFIEVQDQEFEVFIGNFPMSGQENIKITQGKYFSCDEKLSALLKGKESLVSKRLQRSNNINEFYNELQDVIGRLLRGRTQVTEPHPSFYSRIMEEMDNVGWEYLVELGDSLQCLTLQVRDEKDRSHIIKIELDSKYPLVAPNCLVSLPEDFLLQWNSKMNLVDVLNQFRTAISKYQMVWDILQDIDKHCWVLEPQNPNFSDLHRRIAIFKHCSMQVQIDIGAPARLCEYNFMGATDIVNRIQNTLHQNMIMWDVKHKFRHNLEQILKLKLPSPVTTRKEDYVVECGICYSHHLKLEKDNSQECIIAIPDKICDNSKCARAFHHYCLHEWIRSIPTSRQSFDTIFGKCPYCSESISIDASKF